MDCSDHLDKLHTLELEVHVLREKLSAAREATELQAKEYERRLQELNHAHAQQIDRNAEYVPRVLWEAKLQELAAWRQDVDKWRYMSMGVGAAGGALAGFLVSLVGV